MKRNRPKMIPKTKTLLVALVLVAALAAQGCFLLAALGIGGVGGYYCATHPCTASGSPIATPTPVH